MESRVDNLIMTESVPLERLPAVEQEVPIQQQETPYDTISSAESPSYETESTLALEHPENAGYSAMDVDDYGNEVPRKEKIYTQSEVENMIRERISRIKSRDGESFNANPQYGQQASHAFEQHYNPNSSDNWEVQLEQFIDSTLAKREQKIAHENWKRQEQEHQSQFEMKFNSGAAKYSDFDQVLYGKPLTPQMILATRGMQDPAAFVYAAAKTQPQELDRISKIYDPMTQAVELGKLEERMRKARSATSAAPRPINAPKGDMVDTTQRTRNIDDKIRQDEINLRKLRSMR